MTPLNATAPGSRFACRVLSARENERDCKASRGRQCRVWRKRPNVRPSGTPCGAPLSPAARGITNVVATAPGERSHTRGSSLPPPRSPSPFPSCANCIDFLGATSINKVTQVSSVRFNDTSSVCCRVWSPPKATSPALAVYSARLTLPSPSPCPSGNRHTGVCPCLQVLFVCLACLLLAVLDPTRERSHTVLVCRRLADFTQHERLGIHPCCSTWQYLTFFMAE